MNNLETYNRVVNVNVDHTRDFYEDGSLPVPGSYQIVKPTNEVIGWTRDQDGVSVFTRCWHPEVTSHFGTTENPPDFYKTWPVHSVANTYGAEFLPDIDIRDGDPILNKGMEVDEDAYSGFQARSHNGLTLETIIRPIKHERVAVVIGGLATDHCVKATVLDAIKFAHEFDQDPDRYIGVYAVIDAMRAVDPKIKGPAAIREMRNAGARLITSEQLVRGEVIRVEN